MKTPAFFPLIASLVLAAIASDLSAQTDESPEAKALPGTRDVKGILFRDPNFNSRLDQNEKKGAVSGTVWLYRITNTGAHVRFRKVNSNAVGSYLFKNVPFGQYFIAVRYSANKFAVRTHPFRIGGKLGAPTRVAMVRNIPLVTPATINRYPQFSPAPNPDNLDKPGQPPVSDPTP